MTRYIRMLADLESQSMRRVLRPAAGLDFTSNDYLALAGDERIRTAVARALARSVPVGSGGSRLLRGNHPEHELLESEAAAFFGSECALLFGSGFSANTALFATLPQRGDLVVYDEYVHASVHDGMKLGRAGVVPFRHNDLESAASAIKHWRAASGTGAPWIAVESVYSMEGDRAPVAELKSLADACDGFLVVDEAHATGVFGPDGRGLAAGLEGSERVLALHTGGKALGASGALVTGSATLCDFLVNRARPFIYATAPAPLIAAVLREALAVLRDDPARRERLIGLADYARGRLRSSLGLNTSGSQILPIIIGDSEAALRVADRLRRAGFDVRAIRPPTVPDGTARLRISITLHVDEAGIDALVGALGDALRRENVSPGRSAGDGGADALRR